MVLILLGIAINIYNAVKRYKMETKKIEKLERRKRRDKKLKYNQPLSSEDLSTSNSKEPGKVSLIINQLI
jgi:hypothetical protein